MPLDDNALVALRRACARVSTSRDALDAASGETLWRTEGREATNSSVVMADDLLFLLNNDGDLVVARTDRGGFSQITRYEVAESATWAQPAISGNRLFIKDEAHVTLWTIN